MARPLRLHVPGMLYHVMSRGNGKQQIYIDRRDYQHFLRLLAKAAERFDVECVGYCLMPTHYHAILRPRREPLSRMLQQVNSSYAQYFNRVHGRVGHTFQGRFKALLVEGDTYFLTLLRYTMQNPVAGKLARVPSAWRWSSYRATAGLCEPAAFLSLETVWAKFDTEDVKRAQRRFVEFVALPDGSTPLLEALFFGSTQFLARMAPRLDPMRAVTEYTYAQRFAGRPPLAAVLAGARTDADRTAAIREAYFRHAYTLREIGAAVGRHPGTVWRWVNGPGDRTLRRLVRTLRQVEI